jgi:hypothetical protein
VVLRRLTALVLVLSLSFSLAAGAFASTPGAASAQDNASELCKEFLEGGIEAIGSEVPGVIFNEEIELEITHGSCVSLVQAGNFTALAVSICRTLDEEGILEEENVTRGHCNHAVKEFLEEFFGDL